MALDSPGKIRDDSEQLNDANPIVTAYSKIADYVHHLSIPCVVLNGVHPVTGALGRDVDILVPDVRTGVDIARFAHEEVFSREFTWSFLANPQWGPRAFAAGSEHSVELHTVTGLRMGPIPWSSLVTWEPTPGAHGFLFDDVIMTFRLITKMNKSIVDQQPIWESENAFTPLKARRSEIIGRLQAQTPSLVNLVELVLLDDDSPGILGMRRSAMLRFLFAYCLSHPMTATRTFLTQLKRKARSLESPSGVYVSMVTDRPMEAVESDMYQSLGHAFVEITCTLEKIDGSERDHFLARQQLVVHIASDDSELDTTADLTLDESMDCEAGSIVAKVLETLVAVNQKHRNYYVAS